MKDISSLKKKLAGYSAMAGAMIAANQTASDAQAIYHDIVPDTFITDQNLSYYLDMNNDGITDFWWKNLGNGNILLYANVGNSMMTWSDTFDNNFVWTLSNCEVIFEYASDIYYWECCAVPMMGSWSFAGSAPWDYNAIHKFAGVKLQLSDGNHYGWIRMTHHYFDDTLFIEDYAYETIPDKPITTPCATQVKPIAATNLFNALVKDHQLILHFHQSPLPSQMFLLNEVGVRLREQSITQSEMVMDVSQLAAGIYFVVVDDHEKRQVKKVVIVR